MTRGRDTTPVPPDVAARVVRRLLKRMEAKDALLVAYRTGGRPSEKTFKALEQTEGVEIDAAALAHRLEQQT